MERRPGPVDRVADQGVLDGVEVDVVDMSGEFRVVAEPVFPKAALPHALLAVSPPAARSRLPGRQASAERGLDLPPTQEKPASPGGSVQMQWR